MFTARPRKSSGTSTSCKNPHRQTSSACTRRHSSKMRRLNSSRDPASLRLTTTVGTFARLALFKPAASALFERTTPIWARNRPSAMRSSRFCKVVPLPLRRTARRMGGCVMMSHAEDAFRILTQQQPRQRNRLRLEINAGLYEIVREDLRQDAAIHIVLRQNKL